MNSETDLTALKARYLAGVTRTGTMTAGCKAARVSHNTVYRWREEDGAFLAAEREAREAFADMLEEEAVRRAWRGVVKPVYQGGKRVGTVREYSDTLLMFMLNGLRSAKYRSRFEVDIRQAAERLADELGTDADTLIAEAERIVGSHGPR